MSGTSPKFEVFTNTSQRRYCRSTFIYFAFPDYTGIKDTRKGSQWVYGRFFIKDNQAFTKKWFVKSILPECMEARIKEKGCSVTLISPV